jgi:hypothetical protein
MKKYASIKKKAIIFDKFLFASCGSLKTTVNNKVVAIIIKVL